MCIQMVRRGAPIKWDTSDLVEVGQTKIFKSAKSASDLNGIRMNGRRVGKVLSVCSLVGGGAIAELVSWNKKG